MEKPMAFPPPTKNIGVPQVPETLEVRNQKLYNQEVSNLESKTCKLGTRNCDIWESETSRVEPRNLEPESVKVKVSSIV